MVHYRPVVVTLYVIVAGLADGSAGHPDADRRTDLGAGRSCLTELRALWRSRMPVM